MKLTGKQRNILGNVMSGQEGVILDLLSGAATTMMPGTEPDITELETEALDGIMLKCMSAAFYERFTRQQRSFFANKHGFYGLPTDELVEWIKQRIGDRYAIEIGSGNGTLGRALGIRRTDNWIQATPEMRQRYTENRVQPVRYGNDVRKIDYKKAILKFKPQVVVAQWVTNVEKNNLGMDEQWILENCETYIHVGHEKVHACKTILDQPHETHYPPGLFSRSHREREVVYIWSQE